MYKKIVIILICTLMVTSAIPIVSSNIVYKESENKKSSEYFPGTYLIETEWGQHGYYKRLCPYTNSSHTSRCRLGCWSVAIGQIINYYSDYYNLQSQGYVEYNCTTLTIDPWHIVSDLDETDYYWFNMSNKLNSSSSESEKDNVSRLLYDTAIVIQKDFGTGGYLTIDNTTAIPKLINELIDHFPSINAYTEWDTDLTESEIVDEINHGRPIMFYTVGHNKTTQETFPHAMIIDGYEYTGSPPAFNVHINFGWDGPDGLELPNTWYNYYGHFPTFDPYIWFDDINFRKGLYIRLNPTFDSFIGPECAKLPDTCEFKVRTDFDTEPPLEFFFDWGDGSNSGWLGYYRLGETCTASNSWREPGIYDVKVKVKNAMGAEGDWSEPLTVHITKFGFLLPLLELLVNLKNRYPGLEPLLNPFIKLICK